MYGPGEVAGMGRAKVPCLHHRLVHQILAPMVGGASVPHIERGTASHRGTCHSSCCATHASPTVVVGHVRMDLSHVFVAPARTVVGAMPCHFAASNLGAVLAFLVGVRLPGTNPKDPHGTGAKPNGACFVVAVFCAMVPLSDHACPFACPGPKHGVPPSHPTCLSPSAQRVLVVSVVEKGASSSIGARTGRASTRPTPSPSGSAAGTVGETVCSVQETATGMAHLGGPTPWWGQDGPDPASSGSKIPQENIGQWLALLVQPRAGQKTQPATSGHRRPSPSVQNTGVFVGQLVRCRRLRDGSQTTSASGPDDVAPTQTTPGLVDVQKAHGVVHRARTTLGRPTRHLQPHRTTSATGTGGAKRAPVAPGGGRPTCAGRTTRSIAVHVDTSNVGESLCRLEPNVSSTRPLSTSASTSTSRPRRPVAAKYGARERVAPLAGPCATSYQRPARDVQMGGGPSSKHHPTRAVGVHEMVVVGERMRRVVAGGCPHRPARGSGGAVPNKTVGGTAA